MPSKTLFRQWCLAGCANPKPSLLLFACLAFFTTSLASAPRSRAEVLLLLFCFSAAVALLGFFVIQTHAPVCCPAVLPPLVEGTSRLPAFANAALPRMTAPFVPASTLLAYTVTVGALPLTSCVAAWFFAFLTLAAWLLNNILCSDLLPVYRLSPLHAEQQVSPRILPALERCQVRGTKYE